MYRKYQKHSFDPKSYISASYKITVQESVFLFIKKAYFNRYTLFFQKYTVGVRSKVQVVLSYCAL